MTHLTVSGKTIEEAVNKALRELETTKERLSYRVVEEPQKGFLGFLGTKPAIIEAHVKPDPVEEAFAFLDSTLKHMDIPATIETFKREELIRFDLKGDEGVGRLIGKRGQTLDALEYLTNLIANRDKDDFVRIELDAENYRERRKQSLEQLAHRVGGKVIRLQKKVALEPMHAKERKVIHTALQNTNGIETYSEGQGARRHIVIAPTYENES